MQQVVIELKEHMKNRKFKAFFVIETLMLLGLGIEFFLLGYHFLKILRCITVMICLAILAWIDWEKRCIPNKILVIMLAVRGTLLILEWGVLKEIGISILISSVLGMLAGGGMFLICYLLSRGGIGAGDVKLFAVIGCYVGAGSILTVAFLTVMTAALYSIVMLMLKKKSLKEEIPFAPFIWLGTILTMALGM